MGGGATRAQTLQTLRPAEQPPTPTHKVEGALTADIIGRGKRPDAWPDLVLIDGGLGQLSAAREAIEAVGFAPGVLNLVAIAKGPDRNAGREQFFRPNRAPFQLPPNDPALYYLQRLRDEAHRWAIGAHRAKRSAALTGQNPLDEITGVGVRRKKALLHSSAPPRA